MNLTEKIIKEFEEQFVKKPVDWRENNGWTVDYVSSGAEKLKLFLLSSLKQIATEAIEVVRLEKRSDIVDGFDTGFNYAISDIEQKAKKFLEENFGEKKD